MKELASFEFDGIEALLPRESITRLGKDGVVVRLFRRMRTSPLPGMKQPLLNHAIMGLETILEIMFEGRPAAGYRWRLYRGRKFLQKGTTDERGCCGDVQVGLVACPEQYRLLVFRPKGWKAPKEAVSLPSS